MTWDQLVKSLAKDYKNYLNDYRQALAQFNADKVLLLGQHTEANCPENIRDKISRDHEAWKAEWGPNGQRIKTMRAIHTKEINSFFGKNE